MLATPLSRVNTVAYARRMAANRPLTAEDWIVAGFQALAEGGHTAIKAEGIARALKVSKGSFYWHFPNVPAYKATMLTFWQENATQSIIERIEGEGGTPREKLYRLASVSVRPAGYPFNEHVAEAAIRDWARYDENTARLLAQVDQQRLNYVAGLFQDQGLPERTSRQGARLFYASLIGLGQLYHESTEQQFSDLRGLLDLFLSSRS